MSKSEEVMRILDKSKAIISNSHFELSSGRHSDSYVVKEALLASPNTAYDIAAYIAEEFRYDGIEVVIGPAMGGAILAGWVAHLLSGMMSSEVSVVFAEKGRNRKMSVRSYYQKLLIKKRVLVVEDIVTTGASIIKVVDLVKMYNAIEDEIYVGAIVNRGQVTAKTLGVREFRSLCDLPIESWTVAECELCAKGTPVNRDYGAK